MIASAGQVATTRSRRLVAEATALFASSAPVALLRRRVLPALRGAVSFVGSAVSFLHSTGFEILPGNRFVVRGRQRAFIIPARQRTFIIRKGKCMSSISKYPAEERQYQADWSADLNGQTIVGDITAISTDPALIVSKVTYAGPIMKFWLEGGASGRRSTISFIAATSGGEELVWSQTVICY